MIRASHFPAAQNGFIAHLTAWYPVEPLEAPALLAEAWLPADGSPPTVTSFVAKKLDLDSAKAAAENLSRFLVVVRRQHNILADRLMLSAQTA